ncbi:MAG: CHAT domain-containing protein [Planctomycetota bacterium]
MRTDRPVRGVDVLSVSVPESQGWRRVEVFLVHAGSEVILTSVDVDGSAARIFFSDEELLGPDPGRIPGGEVRVRIVSEDSDPVLHQIPAAVDVSPWYPIGDEPEDVLERAARKLREGMPARAAEDLDSLQGLSLEASLASRWMRLSSSVQHQFAEVDRTHHRNAERLLDRAGQRAPVGTRENDLTLIDRAARRIEKAVSTTRVQLWRDELIAALAESRTAYVSARNRGDRETATQALLQVATATAHRGWVEETRNTVNQALDLSGDPETRWNCAVARALSLSKANRLEEARIEARRALLIVEQIRQSRSDDAAALSPRRGPALLLAQIEARLGNPLESLLAAEHVRVRGVGVEAPQREQLIEVARKAKGKARVVVALDAGPDLLVWMTESGGWTVRRIDQAPGEATRKAKILHDSRGVDVESARWIASRIFPADTKFYDRLYLAPVGRMRRIPWGVLPVDGFTLLERCSWSLLPEVSAACKALDPLPREGWWTVVDPVVKGRLPLPGTRAEGKQITDSFPDSVSMMGLAATEPAVRQAAVEARVLHIASHGEFHPHDPQTSLLALTPQETEQPQRSSDGQLTAGELSQYRLSNCRLLALTGCETVIGGATGADDLAGFPRAALDAGCEAILGTLWPVEDAVAGRLVGSLVRATDGQKGPAEVLRHACKELRGISADPSGWSGWVLVENGW